MPAALEIRDHLPRTAVGKLSKKELVEEEREKAADAGGVVSSRRPAFTVIPEAAQPLSGIHDHAPALWVPDSRFAASGMTLH